MTGNFAANSNKYDDGEANYKLPIFNSKDYTKGGTFWLRGVYDSSRVWRVSSGSLGSDDTSSFYYVCPLIYLR